ncbi:hypothetical protein N9J04_01525 [Candidatus Pelagibacter sp.]|nr:hypothetical protein [Candidatus Pelagibacter sp.]
MTWYFDLPNALVCVLVTVIAWRIKIIPNWIAILLVIYSFIPFFLNDFLFPSTYMKDQYRYWRAIEEVRSLNFFPDSFIEEGGRAGLFEKVVIPSWFLSILPIPFVESIKSIGFFNRFSFLILFLWIYSKNFLNGMPLLFILFYPSLLLYTSLSLKDPLVLIFMLTSTIFLIDQKYIKFFITILPLYFFKFQNFFFMILLFFIFLIFKEKKKNNKGYYLLISLIIIICSILFLDDIISRMNSYREGFWRENVISLNTDLFQAFEPIGGIFSLLTNSVIALPTFLLRPLPWQVENIFQAIQSLENIFILFFLIVFTKKAHNQNAFVTGRWVLFLVITMIVHGLVVYNAGTSVRFKYPFIVIFVVGLAYDLYKVNGYRFQTIFKKK